MLLVSGAEDHTVPDVSTRPTLKQYRHSAAITELKRFEGRGPVAHGRPRLEEVADATLQWLHEHDL